MTDYIILCEKSSAAENFAKALGGQRGIFEGKSYEIVAAQGHLLTLKQPQDMVEDEDLKERYSSWMINTMPWNLNHFSWKREPIVYIDRRTKKKTSQLKLINDIGVKANKGSAIVIATDVDPSGEGELIGWEIINAIGWKKPVYRMYFTDEAAPSIQNAFRTMKDISVQEKDGDYLKAEARNRWDYASMQLTRIATLSARHAGYNVVSKQGRLKSVMVRHIFEQEEAIKKYVKKPYFETKFKDENGHVYARKIAADDDVSDIRFENKADGEKDALRYQQSGVTDVETVRKKSAPGKLLDLATLSASLATKGFEAQQVLSVYQNMYEKQYVSYPRTEDKFISTEQFHEMAPLVDQIASVVGVDARLLTHREPRKTHVKDGGAHGANRPGTNIPNSLEEIEKFGGKCGVAIYTMLARNFLAMYGEDYIYDSVTARLEKYPNFTTSFTVPVALNYKLIFDTSSHTKDEDDTEKENTNSVGKVATPFVFEGANKKPTKPTMTWLMKYLEKYDVGTGATRTSTLADISNKKSKMPLLTEKNGALATTSAGKVTAVLAEGTFISSVNVTKQLFDAMKEVGEFKKTIEDALGLFGQVIKHDMPIMIKNGQNLKAVLGEPDKKLQMAKPKPRVTREATIDGVTQEVTFNKVWGTYSFSDTEIDALCRGEQIEIIYKKDASDAGSKCIGRLAQGKTDSGKVFWGFKGEFVQDTSAKEADPNLVMTERNGRKVFYRKTWRNHEFTEEEIKLLNAGETIRFVVGGLEYQGKIDLIPYKGKKYWGFDGKMARTDFKDETFYYTRFKDNDIRFKYVWGGYEFSDDELQSLSKGKTITIVKNGKELKGKLALNTYNGAKYWGFKLVNKK